MKKEKRKMGGFTLVELLVVIGILTILAAIVLVAVNPGRQMSQARDTQRRADVNTLISAVSAYIADPVNNGALPGAGTLTAVCPAVQNIGSLDANLASDLVRTYVADLPVDPSGGDATDTGYDICIADAAANRITVSAPSGELVITPITATR